jgi:hypothetical protein
MYYNGRYGNKIALDWTLLILRVLKRKVMVWRRRNRILFAAGRREVFLCTCHEGMSSGSKSSIRSSPGHGMESSGQPNPATLPLGKKPAVCTEWEAVWAPEPVCTPSENNPLGRDNGFSIRRYCIQNGYGLMSPGWQLPTIPNFLNVLVLRRLHYPDDGGAAFLRK